MASLSWWLSFALYAGLGRAIGTDTAGDVTCTETTVSTNLLSNPSWENGLDGWSYIYPRSVSTAAATDGSYSLLTSGVYPFQTVSQAISGLVPGTTYQASIDVDIVISNIAITESCTTYLYHDTLASTNIIASKAGAYNKNTGQWYTLSGPVTATSESSTFGWYVACSPYRIPQISIYIDNAKFNLDTTTQVCTTATPTLTPISTPPASTPAPQSSIPVSSTVSSTPIGHSSSAASIASSTPIAHSSSAASIASSSPISHSSPAAPITPSSPVGHSSSAPLAPTSTPLLHNSSSASPSSVPLTSTPVDSHTSTSLVSSQSIGYGSSSVIPSAPPSVPTGSTSLTATSSTETCTELQSTSPIPSPSGNSISTSSTISFVSSSSSTALPFSTTVIATEPNQQPSATGPLEPISTPFSPIDLPATTSSGHITTTNVALTTSTVYSTRTSTITACPSSVINCPARSQTTYVTTETIYVSTTVCPVAESEPTAQATSSPTDSPVISVSVSPIFSTRTATITSCPPEVTGCSAKPAAPQIVTETLLVGESTYTLPETAAATYTAHPQVGSTPSSRLLSSVSLSYTTQAFSSHAVEQVKTSGSKTTLSVSSTVPSFSTSTGTSSVLAFNGAESLGRPGSSAQIIASVCVIGLALLWL